MLLKQSGINPDKSDNDGRTPLSYAAGNGYAEVVEMLIKRDNVDPSKRYACDRTPLRPGFPIVRPVKSQRQDQACQSCGILMTGPD